MTEAMTSAMEWLVHAIDWPLGWLLKFPRDFSLLLFAIGTALLMVLIRRAVTNQGLLKVCQSDQRRLKQLLREAKAARDKERQARIRTTMGQIKGVQLVADMRVLGVALVPIAILAIWASERFDYLPTRLGETVIVRATYPASSIDQITHLVPTHKFGLKSQAIQLIQKSTQSPPTGVAEWMLQPSAEGEFTILIRHNGETASHPFSVGLNTYHAPFKQYAGNRIQQTEVQLRRYNPLGLNLGNPWIGLPPWMIGYLILTLALVPILKRLLRVA